MLRRANIYCVKFRGDTSREDGVKKEKLFEALASSFLLAIKR
jgi:hypothetical protein